jgi:G6PDH family F420-dependent oxidoreductase
MVQIGYTAMCEQTPVTQLVTDLAAAEQAGFEFSVMSDHYFPWLEEQGHSGYAWSVLGAATQATRTLPLMTFVTCPTFRYHPAVVAQKAATMGVLSGGRFSLGLGAGENLNEHVVGGGWPKTPVRHERLAEAVDIIGALFRGGFVDYRGRHFTVSRAKLYDLPEPPPPIGIAVSGPDSARLAGEHADCMISTEPDPELVAAFRDAGGAGKPVYGQVPVAYHTDENAARALARKLWCWGVLGWQTMAELPEPKSFSSAAESVSEDDVAEKIPCGPDTQRHVAAVKQFADAGFTHIALVQVGAHMQQGFLDWAQRELLPELKTLG